MVNKGHFKSGASCILIRYSNDADYFVRVFEKYYSIATEKFLIGDIYVVDLTASDPQRFNRDLSTAISNLPPHLRRIGIDVSGMASYLTCLVLKLVREHRSFEKQNIFYTSAFSYVPSEVDYRRLVENQSGDIEYLPPSMALEMSENLILDDFSGHQSGEAKACLVVFAGYEVHRSSGTIDATNPSLLLLFYGRPGDSSLDWRLDLSRKLHAKFERGRRCGAEIVSTLQVQESIDKLEEYYNYIIDDHDLIISPICSKMHTVASYLFWERYGEVQLSFPLPIGYDPTNRPQGVAKIYSLELYEQRVLFRQS